MSKDETPFEFLTEDERLCLIAFERYGIINVLTLVVLTATLGVLILYTIETYRLRAAAQKQVQIAIEQRRMSIQPLVVTEFERKVPRDRIRHPLS